MKVIYCIVFFFAAGLNYTIAQTNCDPDLKHSVQEQSKASYSIRLKSNVAIANAEIILHDLYLGKAVQTKMISISSVETQVFANVKASRYVIYVRQEGCKRPKSIGGLEGILIGNIE